MRRIIAIRPDSMVWNNLGNALKDLGRRDEAVKAYEHALALCPDQFATYVGLAELKRFKSPKDRRLLVLESFKPRANQLPTIRQAHLFLALAIAYDQLGLYDVAFEHFIKANKAKRATITYDERETLNVFEDLQQTFDRPLFKRLAGAGDKSTLPIFILGMPRSGTTLVEQIISSHSRVHGGGELLSFPRRSTISSGLMWRRVLRSPSHMHPRKTFRALRRITSSV